MPAQRTLVLVKPDGVQRNLVGEILGRFESKGLRLLALKMLLVTPEMADKHYAEHIGKPFFPDLKSFITASPTVALVLEGEEAIKIARMMMGATKFTEAQPGTIRGDYAFSMTENLVHGSDSPESAAREIAIFFSDSEIMRR